ncbi:unnamed protein product [Meganyctiphanes norvegica]|uniref:Uncharacterized protein n=1 Tax=Meganyctiphanes norvegica TaxID=48144 RepID=A0AAV2PWY8_MEGNR
MSLPKYIETNWCSKGKAVLSFTSNGKKMKENDTVVYLSTLYIKEFEEKPELPHEECEKNYLNAAFDDTVFTDQQYVRPPGINSEIWQDWLVHWEHWKEIYIPLAWVEKYRSVCTPEYVSWHDDYMKDFPGVLPCIREGLNIQNTSQNPDFEKLENVTISDQEKCTMTVKDTKEDWEIINSEEPEENCTNDDKIVNSSNEDRQESSKKSDMDNEYEKFSNQRYWIHLWIFLNSAGIEENEELSMYFMSMANYEIKKTGPKCDIYNNDTEEQNTPLENSDAVTNSAVQMNSLQIDNLSENYVEKEDEYFSKNNEKNYDKDNLEVHVEKIISKDIINSENIENDFVNENIVPGDCEKRTNADKESENGNENTIQDDIKSVTNNQKNVIEDKLSPRGQKRHMEENIIDDQEFLSKMIVDVKNVSKKCKKNQINQKLSSGLSWAMKYIVKETNETECPFKVSDTSQDENITSEQSKNITSEDALTESTSIRTYKSSNKVDGNDFSEDNDFSKTANIEENTMSSREVHQKAKNKGKKSKNKSRKNDGVVEKVI